MTDREAIAGPIIASVVAAARARGVAADRLARAAADALRIVVAEWPRPQLGPRFEKFCALSTEEVIAAYEAATKVSAPPLFRTAFAEDLAKRRPDAAALAPAVAKLFGAQVELGASLAFFDLFVARIETVYTWLARLLDTGDYMLWSIAPPTETRSMWSLHVDVSDAIVAVEMDGWALRYVT